MVSPEQTTAIAIIGVPGSGKSTFINLASGSISPVNDPSGNRTTELKSSTCSIDGGTVMLIDTPGFGDPTPSVLEVLKLISDRFSGVRSQGIKLAGVIYMHCLAEDRLRGLSRHNFHIFSKFCGGTSLRDVLVVADKQKGIGKEYFFELVAEVGARMLYHDGSRASAHAILRHLLNLEGTVLPAQEESSTQSTGTSCVITSADAARKLTSQVEHHTKKFEELCQRIDAAMFAEDEEARKMLQEEAKNSLEQIEHIRYDLEHMVTDIATKNSRLEDENRRYQNDFAVQKAEAELRIRLLGEERMAREVAEARQERAEAQLAEERVLWERQRMKRERLREHVALKYDKLVACGALIFLAFCVSRFAFHGSPLPL